MATVRTCYAFLFTIRLGSFYYQPCAGIETVALTAVVSSTLHFSSTVKCTCAGAFARTRRITVSLKAIIRGERGLHHEAVTGTLIEQLGLDLGDSRSPSM
jgi:hypothetical protein